MQFNARCKSFYVLQTTARKFILDIALRFISRISHHMLLSTAYRAYNILMAAFLDKFLYQYHASKPPPRPEEARSTASSPQSSLAISMPSCIYISLKVLLCLRRFYRLRYRQAYATLATAAFHAYIMPLLSQPQQPPHQCLANALKIIFLTHLSLYFSLYEDWCLFAVIHTYIFLYIIIVSRQSILCRRRLPHSIEMIRFPAPTCHMGASLMHNTTPFSWYLTI